ncbi:GumC family protein [Nitrincola schmidtii]|uniref:GumC family protein n=1 Tax=Nitrincola schmidtii TaxID=1730894 RepID=UPI00124D2A23|nr:GNVR domain-containing protein [Nitrincola schmidtii]
MQDENEKGLSDYLDIIRRRKYYFILTVPVLAFIAIAIAMSLPPIYRSQGVILIETQEIPADLVRSTVTSFAEQQIQVIRQRVLTTALIQEAIQKHDLYPELRQRASPSQLAQEFRSNVSVDMVNARVLDPRSGRATTANIAFTVAFFDPDPVKAQAVANDLVTTFLSENVRVRTDRAAETTNFLREEANRMRMRVQVLEDRIAQFRTEFSDSLPEMLNFNLSMIERGEERLLSIQNQQAQISDQLQVLRIELSGTPAFLAAPVQGNQPLTPAQRLSLLQEELSQAANRYSDSHPDVVRLRREIQQLESTVGTSGGGSAAAGMQNPQYRQINLQIETLQRDLARLETQRERVEEEIAIYRERVSQTPQVQRGYDDLTRDYESELRKYNELRGNELQAEIAQNLESENKAESFTLLEPPQTPSEPVKPNRKKIMAMGLILSFGAGVGLMILAEMLDGGVRGRKTIAEIMGADPLISVPVIMNPTDYKLQKARIIGAIGVGILVVLAGVAAVHFLFMSLDILWFKVMGRINLM